MKTGIIVYTVAVTLWGMAVFAADNGKLKSGEALFKKHCSVCHPNGGNVINPKKTLKKADLAANGIKAPGDIVKKMRRPGPGMTQFDSAKVPDKEALEIAEYVLATF
ncbi:MAG: c-type cytochrome [Alphaproteobacteria bacterium]|uniref:C-type cytochrome n=1 Tax=Candidatus Nitrobium versatile TaxID=2884831 RepID=A0A953LWY9_9BACT|nr:c-type cytochrome [Candidatus Nitrobium versatile]